MVTAIEVITYNWIAQGAQRAHRYGLKSHLCSPRQAMLP